VENARRRIRLLAVARSLLDGSLGRQQSHGILNPSEAHDSTEPDTRVPAEPLPRLFWRFLRFGLLAWGGPMAQIAMIRQELV
jgi:hypothetical protein